MDVSKPVAVLLVVASALAGCSALTLSINYANCAAYGVVSIHDDTFSNYGTVCGTVSKPTANYICGNFGYGTAVDYGTATSKGVAGGTGAIAGTNLTCDSADGCTYNSSTSGCTHSNDLVVKCSNQLNCPLTIGEIVAIVVVVVFFVLVLPLICACLCCCVCWCLGAACFASSTPDYGKL